MNAKQIIIVILLLVPPTVARGVTRNWVAGTGNWNVAGNWSPSGVPLASDAVNIVHADGVQRSVTLDTNTPALGVLSIDLTGAGTTASTLSLPNNNNLTAAVFDVGGYNGAAFTNGRGAVNQSAGTMTVSPGGDLILGVGSGSVGTYTLSGGALVTNQSVFVALNGTGTFNHSGGTNTINANAVGSFFVGYNAGPTGTYNLNGTGALASNEAEYIGYSGTGIFTQTGGSNIIGAGENLYLGYNTGSFGTYTINGGTLSTAGVAVVGSSGTGTLNISGSASVHVGMQLSINSASAVNLNGGTLRFDFIGGSGGAGRIFYTGGTIQLAGNRDFSESALIQTLYGTNPTVPAGKALVVEGDATVYNTTASGMTLRVNGGSLTSAMLEIGKYFGGAGRTGHLEITNGSTVTSMGQGRIGFDNFAVATATVSGPGSAWNIGDDLWVGGQGDSAVLNIRDGALVNVAVALNLWADGVVNLDGGTLRFDEYLRFNTGQPFDGVFNFYAGTLQLAGNRDIGADAAIADIVGAAPTLTSGKGLTVEGTATLSTIVTLDGGTLSANQLANGNNLRLQRGTLNLTNQAVTIGAGGLLGSTLDLNDDATVNVALGITNQGLVTGDGQLGGTFTNAASGDLRAEPGRSLTLTGANNTNAGQINLYGGMLDFTQNLTNSAGAFISGNGTLKTVTGLTNHGTMNFSGLANVAGDVTNSATGKIISSGGGPTTFLDDVVNSGEIRTSAGSYTVFFGSVTGAGSFTGLGTVNFEGDLKPGSSPAILGFAGDVVFGQDATLSIEIGGVNAGSQYDQLNVAGKLTTGGTLAVSLINGFLPAAGQSFDILNWSTLAGTFSTISLPTLTGGRTWNISQLYSLGVLSITASLVPGDFDSDGDVDGADFVAWQTNFPKASGATLAQGDADGDGDVDGADFVVWQTNFPYAPGPGATPVPEPHSIFLLAASSATLFFRRSTGKKIRSSTRRRRLHIERLEGRAMLSVNGDFNGDGYDDLAIGATGETVAGVQGAGAVTIIYGSRRGLTAVNNQTWNLNSPGVNGVPSTNGLFGYALAIGDFNADGRDDLAIGAPTQNVAGITFAGQVNVLYGSSTGLRAGTTDQLWTQNSSGVNGTAERFDQFGDELAVGDFNNDGRDDLAIGVPFEDVGSIFNAGMVHVLFGSTNGLTSANDQTWHQNSSGINDAAETDDLFGFALAVGDFNRDGRDDLAIGSPFESLEVADCGAINVIYGASSGLSSSGDQFWTQSPLGSPPEADDRFGYALAAGDFDGDTYDDLAVGVPGEDGLGIADFLYGSATKLQSTGGIVAIAASLSGYATSAGAAFGGALASGDFNNDGFADLAIGADGETVGGFAGAGAVYVAYGSTMTGVNKVEIWHQNSTANMPGIAQQIDSFGRSVVCGDYNGDGYADLAIGIPGEKFSQLTDVGAVQILYGFFVDLTDLGNQFWSQAGLTSTDGNEDGDRFGRGLG